MIVKRRYSKAQAVIFGMVLSSFMMGCSNSENINDTKKAIENESWDAEESRQDISTSESTKEEIEQSVTDLQIDHSTDDLTDRMEGSMRMECNSLTAYEQQAALVVREHSTLDTSSSLLCMTADYDQDNQEETFIVIGDYDEEWQAFYSAELYYVEDNCDIQTVSEAIDDISGNQEIYKSPEDNRVYLLLDSNYATGYNTTVCYVEQGAIRMNPLDYGIYIDSAGTPAAVQSAYSMEYDIESDFWIGHTWNTYPGTIKDGAFSCIPAVPITENDLSVYTNGKELLDSLKSSHPDGIFQILKRGENLIHINVAEVDEGFIHFSCYSYVMEQQELHPCNSPERSEGYYLCSYPCESATENSFDFFEIVLDDIGKEKK